MCLFGNGCNSDWIWIVVIALLVFCCSDGNLFGGNSCGNGNGCGCDSCC